MSEETALVALCNVTEIPAEAPLRVEHAGFGYAVYAHEGRFYVTQDECTHGPGFLSEGLIEGCEVECPFHQGKFDFTTGQPTLAPCVDPLRTWTPRIHDGKVWIDPTEPRA